jgi:hypothetical protein
MVILPFRNVPVIQRRTMERYQTLINKHVKFFDAMLEDQEASEPVLDYITDLDARVEILLEFRRLAQNMDRLGDLNGVALGIVLVAPLDQLRLSLDRIKDAPSLDFSAHGLVNVLCEVAIKGIRACTPPTS